MSSVSSFAGLLALVCAVEEPRKHPLDLNYAGFQGAELSVRNQAQVPGKQEVVLKFARRAKSNVKKLPQLGIRPAAAALSYVCWDGKRGSPHLTSKAKDFGLRKHFSDAVHAQSEQMAFLPDLQFGVVLHGSSFSNISYYLLITVDCKLQTRSAELQC